MRIVFEVGHPAHVHLFKHVIRELRQRGHSTKTVAISKETTLDLLKLENLDYIPIGKNNPSLVGKALTLPAKDLTLVKKIHSFKPDLLVSTDSPYSAHASAVLGIPHIAFGDTEIATTIIKLMLPYTDTICTPSSYAVDLGPKQVRYEGYHQLAYLHPNRFKPNPLTLTRVGLRTDDTVVVVRFSTKTASHDVGYSGLHLTSVHEQLAFVRCLERYGKVVVTSEFPLQGELNTRIARVPYDEIHNLLYYASLYVGDGATMAGEAGVLGTPWIYISDSQAGVLNEQRDRYGLGFTECTAQAALARAVTLLQQRDLKNEWQLRRDKMLAEKIDLTQFIVDFILEWPDSRTRAASSDVAPRPPPGARLPR